ncbi:hypothetical protein G9A89_017228 [Geosiphon pyriformis]|nr:hypothetical protein G9A89_017228 [Geosiphon pyriformis]
MNPIPLVSMKLNNRLAALKCSFASLAEHVNKLAKKLNTSGPMVFQLSSEYIVMNESSGVITSGKTVAEVVVVDQSAILKIEVTLKNLSVTVIDLMAKIDNSSLVSKVCLPQ